VAQLIGAADGGISGMTEAQPQATSHLLCHTPHLLRNGGWIRAEYTIKYGAVIVIFFLSGATQAQLHLACP
jgi:hypothetical protein